MKISIKSHAKSYKATVATIFEIDSKGILSDVTNLSIMTIMMKMMLMMMMMIWVNFKGSSFIFNNYYCR